MLVTKTVVRRKLDRYFIITSSIAGLIVFSLGFFSQNYLAAIIAPIVQTGILYLNHRETLYYRKKRLLKLNKLHTDWMNGMDVNKKPV